MEAGKKSSKTWSTLSPTWPSAFGEWIIRERGKSESF